MVNLHWQIAAKLLEKLHVAVTVYVLDCACLNYIV
jgi:hypothetical protein